MSAKTDKLLALYRTYENLVRDAGTEPKLLEADMDGILSSEMTMIRQFRNFLSHTPDPGFLEPTDKMLAVLSGQVDAWSMKGDVVKKHLKSPAASICSEKDTCADGIAKLAKLRRDKLAVQEKSGGYHLCDLYAMAALLSASKASRLSACPALKEKIVFTEPGVLLEKLDPGRVTLCTADGTPEGKLLGTVIFP